MPCTAIRRYIKLTEGAGFRRGSEVAAAQMKDSVIALLRLAISVGGDGHNNAYRWHSNMCGRSHHLTKLGCKSEAIRACAKTIQLAPDSGRRQMINVSQHIFPFVIIIIIIIILLLLLIFIVVDVLLFLIIIIVLLFAISENTLLQADCHLHVQSRKILVKLLLQSLPEPLEAPVDAPDDVSEEMPDYEFDYDGLCDAASELYGVVDGDSGLDDSGFRKLLKSLLDTRESAADHFESDERGDAARQPGNA